MTDEIKPKERIITDLTYTFSSTKLNGTRQTTTYNIAKADCMTLKDLNNKFHSDFENCHVSPKYIIPMELDRIRDRIRGSEKLIPSIEFVCKVLQDHIDAEFSAIVKFDDDCIETYKNK